MVRSHPSDLARAGRRRTRLEVARVAADRVVERVRAAVEDPLAVGEHEQPVAVALGLEQVVGRVDHGGSGPGEREDELPQPLALPGIEARGRLVEQQHPGLGDQPDRDVHPLLVAAREGPDLIVASFAEPGLLEHPLDLALDVGGALEASEQAQVLSHRQPAVEAGLLRHPADLVGSRERARIRAADPGEDREQGGLAGPVGADHRQQLAPGGAERDLAQRRPITEALRQPARLDHGLARLLGPAHRPNAITLPCE